MASKTSLLLALAFAVVLLTTSEVVATKELASNRHGEVDHNYGGFNGNGVGRGGYNNGVGRGGYNSNGEVDHNYGGYNGNGVGRGGYNNNGVRGYNNDGIGRGGYNNNGGGRHGGCSYGCCGGGRYYLGGGCRCCSSFAEATAYKQTQS